jgi:hypothetical protein
MRYLFDFAESVYILFGRYADFLAAGIIVAGIVITVALAMIPHITRRV